MELSQDIKKLNLKLSYSCKRGRNGEKDLGCLEARLRDVKRELRVFLTRLFDLL
jgi:hypothetical protein